MSTEESGKLKIYFEQLTYYVKNYWIIVTALIIIYAFWNTYEMRMTKHAIDELRAELKDSKKYAIKVNNRNQIEGFELKKISDKDYKFMLAGLIERYLVKSAEDLKARAGRNKTYKNIKEFFAFQSGPNGLKEFYYNFIYSKNNPNKSEEILALEKQGQADFMKFLSNLALNLRDKNIPQSKDTLGVNAKDIIYTVKGKRFTVEFKIQMKTAGVTKEGIAYKNIPQEAWFKLEGYINEEDSHEILNPLGIKFNSIQARPTLHPQKALDAIKLKREKEKREQKRREIMQKNKKRRY